MPFGYACDECGRFVGNGAIIEISIEFVDDGGYTDEDCVLQGSYCTPQCAIKKLGRIPWPYRLVGSGSEGGSS